MNKKKNSKIIKKPEVSKKQDKKIIKPVHPVVHKIKDSPKNKVNKVSISKKKILKAKKSFNELDKSIKSIEEKFVVQEKEYEERFDDLKIETQSAQQLPVEDISIEDSKPDIPEEIIAKDEESEDKDSEDENIEDIPIKSDVKKNEAVIKPTMTEQKIIDDSDNKYKVEALLFASGKYLDEETIASLCEIDKKKVKKALDELRKDYDSRNCSLMIFQEDHSWKINVREKYLSIVRKIVSDTELNRSTLETLSVIAWKSPIYQSEIVRIRGNKCYDHIDSLETLGFITKEKKGRSYVLKTTDKFHNYFDIDRGNLKGVLETVKVPEPKSTPQQTLENIEEKNTSGLGIVDAINIKKKTETEEEKQSHKEFLDKMEQKIMDVAQKNKLLEEEIPSRNIPHDAGMQPIENASNIPNDTVNNNTTDNTQDNMRQANVDTSKNNNDTNNTNPETGRAGQAQQSNNPADIVQEPRHKSLTKKQLEKKFREELLKVREKMQEKK